MDIFIPPPKKLNSQQHEIMPLPTFEETMQLAMRTGPDEMISQSMQLAASMTREQAVQLADVDYLTQEECSAILQRLFDAATLTADERRATVLARSKGDRIGMAVSTELQNREYRKELTNNQIEGQ